jgi:hypothetical protein
MKKLFLLIFILISSNAQSQDLWLNGLGTTSCGKFIEHKNKNYKPQLDMYVQWTWGFLSAYNLRGSFGTKHTNVSPTITSFPDNETVILFITKECEKNPLSDVVNVVMRLGKSLGGKIDIN